MGFHRLCIVLTAAGLLSGCAEGFNRLKYDTRAPLRVAVLPFTESHSGDTFTSAPFTAMIDALPVVGRDDDRGPATILRSRFTAKLRHTRLEIVDPSHVDSVLIERGLYDRAAFLDADPRGLGELLGADAIVYGEVVAWDRTYLVAESWTSAGLRIEMIESRSGAQLWEAQQVATQRAGLSEGPTGYVSAGIEPIRGLSGAVLYNLADEAARKIIEPHILQGGEGSTSAPPFIAASALSTPGPSGREARIEFVAIGSPGCRATCSLGSRGREIPMTEYGKGIYVGTHVVQPGERLETNRVEVRLIGPHGEVTVQSMERAGS